MIPNLPLRFSPIFRSYLWGGTRLKETLQKAIPSEAEGAAGTPWAESWEIVDHGRDQTMVVDGPWAGWTLRRLIEGFPEVLLGENNKDATFPLLLKYLDCNRVLSVQVHPNDAYGLRMPVPDLGKTEAWYVLQADKGSRIYAGLKIGIDRKSLEELILAGRSEEALHVLEPKQGDCVFIPAGTVHALGEGLLVAEIQQASDTTFRLYDWDRLDQNGIGRPLHIRQALEVIDFERGPVDFASPVPLSNGGERMVQCDKFTLDRYNQSIRLEIPNDDRFRIVTVVKGNSEIQMDGESIDLSLGQTILIPARHVELVLDVHSDATVLIAMESEE